jgi:hypothetical protein
MKNPDHDLMLDTLKHNFPESHSKLVELSDIMTIPVNDMADFVISQYLDLHTLDQAVDEVMGHLNDIMNEPPVPSKE